MVNFKMACYKAAYLLHSYTSDIRTFMSIIICMQQSFGHNSQLLHMHDNWYESVRPIKLALHTFKNLDFSLALNYKNKSDIMLL